MNNIMNNTEDNNDKKKTKDLSDLTQGEMLGIFIIACIIISFVYAVYSSTEESPFLYNIKKTFLELVEMDKNDPEHRVKYI